MRCEVTQFQRCCFCLPLRYGLIAWGYFKMIMDALIIIRASFDFIHELLSLYENDKIFRRIYISDIVIMSILLFVFVIDFALTTVFIIGGHTKNVKLIKVFYYYSQVMWILMVLLSAVAVGFTINSMFRYFSTHRWVYLAMDFSFYFANIAIQFYILLLLRSEIIKLNNNCEFRFVNNAADAECTMTRQNDISNGVKEIEAVEDGALVIPVPTFVV